MIECVALVQDARRLEKNIEHHDEHTPRMVRPPHTESYLYGKLHKLSARVLGVPVFCAASEYDVEGYH